MLGASADEDAIARGEKALPAVIRILEGQLANGKWLLGDDFTLIECAYGLALHVLENAGFSFREFPRVRAYHIWMPCARVLAWQKTPKLPGL